MMVLFFMPTFIPQLRANIEKKHNKLFDISIGY